MTLAHAANLPVDEVVRRISRLTDPLWREKEANIAFEKYTMYQLLAGHRDGYRSQARDRLKREMELRVDEILVRSLDLHTVADRCAIALMCWERNSETRYQQVVKDLPGGAMFFYPVPDATLSEQLAFRAETLPNLVAAKFEHDLFRQYMIRLGMSINHSIRNAKARAGSQDVSSRVVTLYFDSEEDAVYARCLI